MLRWCASVGRKGENGCMVAMKLSPWASEGGVVRGKEVFWWLVMNLASGGGVPGTKFEIWWQIKGLGLIAPVTGENLRPKHLPTG